MLKTKAIEQNNTNKNRPLLIIMCENALQQKLDHMVQTNPGGLAVEQLLKNILFYNIHTETCENIHTEATLFYSFLFFYLQRECILAVSLNEHTFFFL